MIGNITRAYTRHRKKSLSMSVMNFFLGYINCFEKAHTKVGWGFGLHTKYKDKWAASLPSPCFLKVMQWDLLGRWSCSHEWLPHASQNKLHILKVFLARYFVTTVRKATDTVGSFMMKRLSCLVLLGVLFGS